MEEFKFICTPSIIFGPGSLAKIPSEIKRLKGTRAFVVLDARLAQQGLKDEIAGLLKAQNVSFLIYDRIAAEPDTDAGNEAAAAAKKESCDIVLGIGGGSSMDTAKAVSVLLTNGGKIEDYQGLDKVPGPGVPKIMVPTTAGTGSEVTWTAVFIRKTEKKKAGINSVHLYPESAILDPELTTGLPPFATAFTGLDAFCHAIESYVSGKSNFLTEAVSEKALALIWENLPLAYAKPSDTAARGKMLYASFLAGLGLVNAGVTAVHSLSYPLGGTFNVPHGVGNAALLSWVLEDALPEIEPKLARLSRQITGQPGNALSFIGELRKLEKQLKIPLTLRELAIPEEAIPALAEDALKVSVPLENHPKKLTKKDIINIYKTAY